MSSSRVARCGLTAICWLSFVLAAQMQLGPDELSVRGGPYSPLSVQGLIRTQVELVEVPVVVRNGKGAAVPDLKREDFEILDSGKKRDIAAFSVETFTPKTSPPEAAAPSTSALPASIAPAPTGTSRRFIGLILDDMNTGFGDLRRAKTAAAKFVSESLAPGDLVAIFTIGVSQSVVFTSNPEKLRDAIEHVTPHPRYSDDMMSCPRIRAYEAYLISNSMDSEMLAAKIAELRACQPQVRNPAEIVKMQATTVWEQAKANTENTLRSIDGVVRVMSGMPGRRMVLLTSAGFLSGDVEDQLQALSTKALHSGVIINTMDLKGLYTVIPGGDASEPRPMGRVPRSAQITELKMQGRMESAKDDGLAVLASATGGQFFHNSNDLAGGLRRLGAVPEVMYVLGFSPGDVPHDGAFHPLKVRLTGGHRGSVQARMGYSAPPKENPVEVARQKERDRILMGANLPADVPVSIASAPGKAEAGHVLEIAASFDLNRLNFENKQHRRTQMLSVIAVLLDGSGNFVTGTQGDAKLALKDPSYEELAKTGMNLRLSLRAAPGPYNLRVLVQESLTGKTTAVSRPVEIP